jgi:hypothetical protein
MRRLWRRPLLRNVTAALLAATVLGFSLIAGGCSSRETLHPALRIDDEDMSRAVRRGKGVIAAGSDPEEALKWRLEDINVRVSGDVILRSAGCCYPQDEVCYRVAVGGDKSDAGVRRAVNEALKTIGNELRCLATVQLPKTKDPASIDFALRTSLGVEYPPIAVQTPQWVRDITPIYDASGTSSALYYYVIRFPVRGGPGVPPVGPNVRSLSLIVKDGDAEASATFNLPVPRTY